MLHVDAGDVITYKPDPAINETERATVTHIQPPADAPPDAGTAVIHLQLLDGSLHQIPQYEVVAVPVPMLWPEHRERKIRTLAMHSAAWRVRYAPIPTHALFADLLPDEQIPIVRNALADLMSQWATVDGQLNEFELEQLYEGDAP